jgi:hypothetical protein
MDVIIARLRRHAPFPLQPSTFFLCLENMMPDCSDTNDVPRSDRVGQPYSDSSHSGQPIGSLPVAGLRLIELEIERDLAVQLVGSDAGKARRMRPHGAMTQGASPVEIADVGAVMEPFLRDEIRRVHEDKTHRPKISMVRATPQQALALKSFCQHFATYLMDHLGKNGGDENAYRSQQRLNQANRVIDQINRGLDLRSDLASRLEQCRREVIMKAEGLKASLEALTALGAEITSPADVRPLAALQQAVRFFLSQRPLV